jgi:hypothetical protein
MINLWFPYSTNSSKCNEFSGNIPYGVARGSAFTGAAVCVPGNEFIGNVLSR